MASISSLGIGSGVLTSNLIDQLVQANQKPENDRLTQQQTDVKNKESEFAKIQSAVTDLRLPARTLSEPGALLSYSVNSGSSAINGTVTDNKQVQPGQYSVSVSQIAQAQSLATGTLPDSNTTTLGTGQLTISVGSTTKTITVDNTNNTLQGLANTINSSNIGVSATVVNTGAGYRMVMSSQQTGTANAINISVQDSDGNNTDNSGLSQLAYNSTTKNLTQTVAAKDASLSVNGVSVTQSSNTVTGVIPGVTLNLAGQTTGNTLLTIGQDTSAATKEVQNLVDAYNKLQSLVANDTKYDPSAKQGGIFLGDSTVNSIMTQVRNTMSQLVPGLGNASVQSLSEIGISTDPHTGQISFDQTKFASALQAHPQDVAAIFGDQGRTTDPQVQFETGSVNSKAGTYAINVTQAATQGAYTGSVALGSNTVIGSTNNTLSLNVDGSTTASLTLAQGTYATPQDLVNQIQTQLDSNKALQSAGIHVTAGLDSSNHLTLTSGTYGSQSQVNVTAVGSTSASTLGLSVANGTAGQDVAGTINGVKATGSGQVLTGASGDNSDGVAVKITGSATGSRGSVTYIRGIGDQMVNLINGFLNTNGIITDKNNFYQKQLSDISKQQQDLSNRMNQYKQQLQTEFSSADARVAKYNSTLSFLQAQLGALAGSSSSGSSGSGGSSGGSAKVG